MPTKSHSGVRSMKTPRLTSARIALDENYVRTTTGRRPWLRCGNVEPTRPLAVSAQRWVALLRGINVGRNKRVTMADLRALLESLGYDEVRTHGQSGNAVFATERGRAPELEGQIAARIEADLGMEVKVLVRAAGELAAVVDQNPFVARRIGAKELHVAFCSAAPSAGALATVDPEACAPDEFALGPGVIYVRLPNGVTGSRLPDWERVLGVDVTARNWNTVTRLHELTGG